MLLGVVLLAVVDTGVEAGVEVAAGVEAGTGTEADTATAAGEDDGAVGLPASAVDRMLFDEVPLLPPLVTPTGDEECAVESKTTDAREGDETAPVVPTTKLFVIVCTSALTAFRVAIGIYG